MVVELWRVEDGTTRNVGMVGWLVTRTDTVRLCRDVSTQFFKQEGTRHDIKAITIISVVLEFDSELF